MPVQIARDPFARTTLMRRKVVVHTGGCTWCGSRRQHKGKTTLLLFQYFTETDGGREHAHTGAFCCKSCHDSYHA
jgi:predicted metalloprotease